MSKTIKTLLIVCGAAYLIFATVQWFASRGDARSSWLLYLAEQKLAGKRQAEHDKKLAEYQDHVNKLMGYADSLNTKVEEGVASDADKAREIAKLQEKLKGVTDQGERIKLLEGISLEKDVRISGLLSALDLSRNESLTIRAANDKLNLSIKEWAGKFDEEHKLRLKAEDGFRKATSKLALIQKTSKLKTYLTIGAGLVLVGSLIAK